MIMKKLKLIFILFIMMVTVAISPTIYINAEDSRFNMAYSKSSMLEEVGGDNKLTFAVLGDVHGNGIKLDSAINDLYSVNSNMDAMILNGDNVDEGTQKQYDELNSIFNKNDQLLPKTIIKNIGNHDYFEYGKDKNSQKDADNFINLYMSFSGESAVYHDTWIKGYHFISLGSENINLNGAGADKAYLSDKQLDWLKYKLSENHEQGKPVFVFLHQHLNSSIKGLEGILQKNDLVKIMSQYPEAILFTSHTHVLLSIDNIILEQPFITVNTGAVHYTYQPEEYNSKSFYDDSEGLYVEVSENKVTIKGRDFVKKSWIFTKEISISR